MGLLEAVRKVIWIEIIALLVGFVYRTFSRLVNGGQLNKIAFVYVEIVDGSVVIGRILNAVVNHAIDC
jgi:hypothetical protein